MKVCCAIIGITHWHDGAIHLHAGSEEPAREMADANIAALAGNAVDAVIVNVAGCGSMLKDYGHHWHDEKQPERAKFAEKVRDAVCPEATLHFDTSKPDGTPRKVLDTSKLNALGWEPSIDLDAGIASTYEWFLANVVSGLRGV